ncbi:conjugative transposon protein TraM [Chryseobacterium potabilaquae]|uniref:Conjugative transposon TraM C-terminal domain-containing protein n=1 Tax=Chryseobacterium potabilaquae TaxID=2675057 RepID=A0A6N4XFM1_9FLAO|nr:conjugative transposon protein TraM [Chryseobacterium potabilaquae]CAA7197457.1 hypothetical protein CHRY9293_03516 [Chryseobacterium potabilaquae]
MKMNKKLLVIVGIGTFLIISLIMFMFLRSSGSDSKKTNIAPTIGMNNEVTVEDMVKARGETKANSSTGETPSEMNSNVVSEEEIKNAILSNTNIGSNKNTSYSPPPTNNSHSVYGTYDMWENKEPSNSKIGYSNAKPIYKEKTSPKTIDNAEKEITNYEPVYQSEVKKQTILASVNAESISQGYISNGRKWNFIFNESFTLNGDKIPENNSSAEGVMKIEGGRVFCKIFSVKANGKTYAVLGKIVGVDGEEGYFLPEIGDDSDQSLGGALKDEANNQVSRIPIVGGVLSRTTSRNRTTKKIPLAEDIQVKIILYKN